MYYFPQFFFLLLDKIEAIVLFCITSVEMNIYIQTVTTNSNCNSLISLSAKSYPLSSIVYYAII